MAAPPSASLESAFRNARIIHAALVASVAVYAVVVHVLRATVPVRPLVDEPVLEGIRLASYFLGGALVLAVLLLRARWLSVDAAAPLPVLQTRSIICLAVRFCWPTAPTTATPFARKRPGRMYGPTSPQSGTDAATFLSIEASTDNAI